MKKINYPQQKETIQKIIFGDYKNLSYGSEIYNNVAEILSQIQQQGTEKGIQKVFEYTKKFDHVDIDNDSFQVSQQEIESSKNSLTDEFKKAVDVAIENIKTFHEKQLLKDIEYTGKHGEKLSQRISPIEKVGLYVPGGVGGKTPLVSSLLMNALPAIVAGCKEIIITTPPREDKTIDPHLLYACDILGLNKIYKCGGAQAVAAMAYGTSPIEKVDIIIGPGNPYVTCAKKMVYGDVMIDGLYGPSEIIVISDGTENPKYIACDLLSQAEHAGYEMAMLITDNEKHREEVLQCIEEEKKKLSREKIIDKSLASRGLAVLVDNLEDAFQLTNEIAPEHLEILTKNSDDKNKIHHAGTIFSGGYSSEPIGDYICGTNHVLPTGGNARFQSPLGVYTFLKRTNIIEYNQQAFDAYQEHAQQLAITEGLTAHQRALSVRKD